MILEEKRDFLINEGGLSEDAILFDNASYDKSIIGVSDDYRAIYDYESMIEEIAEDNNWDYEEAREWVDYNTLRALPYMGGMAPIILMNREQTEMFNDVNTNIENKKTIVCIVGKSGVGKTMVINELSKDFEHYNNIASFTTRPKREDETNGIEHTFVSDIDIPCHRDMIAYTYFGGYHYWAVKQQVMPKVINLYAIDEVGLVELKKRFTSMYDIKAIKIVRNDCDMDNIDKERKSRDDERIEINDTMYDAIIYNDGTKEDLIEQVNRYCQNLN